MADTTVRRNAEQAARGFFWNIIAPFAVGIAGALFFAVFVPDMIELLHAKKSFTSALHTSWQAVITPYMSFNDPNYKMPVEFIAWPVVGGIICTFLWRLYLDG